MWPFTKPTKSADITAAELVEKVAECLARVRALELDQERLYDKVRGVLASISRKAKLLEESDDKAASPSLRDGNGQLSRGDLLRKAREKYAVLAR